MRRISSAIAEPSDCLLRRGIVWPKGKDSPSPLVVLWTRLIQWRDLGNPPNSQWPTRQGIARHPALDSRKPVPHLAHFGFPPFGEVARNRAVVKTVIEREAQMTSARERLHAACDSPIAPGRLGQLRRRRSNHHGRT